MGQLSPASAQYRFEHWTTENGLPQNTVRALVQTRDGYIWIATLGGLARFDGKRFTVFTKVTQPEMRSNRLTDLHEDRAGRLWIGTEEGGLLRYDNGVFTSWTTKEGLPGNFIDRIEEDEAGTILIFTDQGVTQWRDGRFSPLPLTFQPFIQSSPMMLMARYLNYTLRQDATGYQLFYQGHWEHLPRPFSGAAAGVKGPFGTIMPGQVADALGRLWFNWPTASGYYTRRGTQWETTIAPPTQGAPFYLDRQGRYWTIYKTGVALEKDGQTSPLPVQGVNWWYRVLEDREGNIWLGTYENGLLRLLEQTVTFLPLPGRPTERYVYPLLESRVGNVWISAGEAGLTHYANEQFTRFPLPGAKGSRDISSFYEDRDGSLLVGTYLYGLTRFREGQWRKDEELSARVKGRVDVIFRDRQGDLWFGGQNGLDRQTATGQWTHFGPDNGLPTKHVKTLLEDSAGRLWIGGIGCLALWDKGQFTTWTPANGLVADRIVTLYEDSDHRLWVGAAEAGLYRFQPTTTGWQLTRYTTREGLFSNEVKQIFEDESGYFWIGSEQGIYRLSKQELNDFADGRTAFITSLSFGKADGLLTTACIGGFQPAGFKGRDGRFWFPTMDGIAIVDPHRVGTNTQQPPVAIEDCLLDHRNVDWRQGVTINPGQVSLEINYTGLSFHKADQMRFRYRLEGLEETWIEVGPRRTAYYSHLPSGNYTFHVIAANSDGVWNTEGQRLRIRVIPPFYRRWWFVLCAVAALAGLVLFAFQYRIRQLQRAQLAQQQFSQQLIESQEAERKRIAAELHDSLGQNLIVIKNWATLGLTLTEDDAPVREQLDVISTTAVQSLNEVRAIIHNLRPHQLETIGLANTLRFMLEQISGATGLAFTSEIAPLDKLFAPEDEVILYRLVQECISNIVKHAQATQATLMIKIVGEHLHITVTDNGRGFVTTPINPPSGGFGLKGLEERVRILRGTHKITSAPGKGTTHSFVIPITTEPPQ
ncbi:MAG: two-component regulator propeller domain-containing protein [Blastocatellia bacterium]